MAEHQNRAEVEIFGKTYTLVSAHEPTYAHQIAEEVDRRMRAIAAKRNLADTTKIAMMAAMQIADELMRARQEGETSLAAAEAAGNKLTSLWDETST